MVTQSEQDDWARKNIEALKERGYLKSPVKLYVTTAFALGLLFAFVFYYVGWMGWFSDQISQDVKIDPNIDVSTNITNNYELTNPNENNNNFSIYVNNFVTCPTT